MKVCPYCGRENDDALANCRECGSALAEPAEPAPISPVLPQSNRTNSGDWVQSWHPRTEFVIVIVLCLGWFLLGSLQSLAYPAETAALEDYALRALTRYELITGLLALLFLWARGWKIQDFQIGLSWVATALAIPLVVINLYAYAIVTSVFEQFVGGGQQLDNIIYSVKVSLSWAILGSIVNGAFEEVVLVGYTMQRFRGAGFGTALGVSVLLRSILHFYQGPIGVASITVLGIMFGTYYWFFGRLWTLILAHMLLDLLAFTQF